ncbi:MAG TPA: hypothetical protein VGM07_08930 [Stellaceae bacterium]|jgi:hypothetical protein
MMFIVRSASGKPGSAAIRIKGARKTPVIVAGAAGETDYFCVGEAEAMAALRAEGWEVVELRDGWYEDDAGGGIAISGQGRYWEVRDTPFTVVEAASPAGAAARTGAGEGGQVDVRGAVFGV